MLKGICCRGTFFWFVGQKLRDKVLAVIGNVVPSLVIEGKCTSTHFFHDFLIALAIKRWHSRKENVGDDTNRPDITLGIVALVENFWSNVIRSSKFLIQLFIRIVDERCSEINNLDLIEFLVLLEENILGFKISAKYASYQIDDRKDLVIQSYLWTILF